VTIGAPGAGRRASAAVRELHGKAGRSLAGVVDRIEFHFLREAAVPSPALSSPTASSAVGRRAMPR
jgi:hypothetical protein